MKVVYQTCILVLLLSSCASSSVYRLSHEHLERKPGFVSLGVRQPNRSILQHRTPGALASALESQKSFWKFVGIMTLIVLGLYLLVIVIAVLFGIFTAAASVR